jgi:hypothetical protein
VKQEEQSDDGGEDTEMDDDDEIDELADDCSDNIEPVRTPYVFDNR